MTKTVALALLLLLLACSPQQSASETALQIDSKLLDFESLQAFSETFNRDTGEPRLMLLLSPT